jgi:hypothetical protein
VFESPTTYIIKSIGWPWEGRPPSQGLRVCVSYSTEESLDWWRVL